MSDARLSTDVRTEFGKGSARRTRREGKIPAVIYGHGAEPRHISLPAREFTAAIKRGGGNVLLTLVIEGKDELTIPKAIQRHPIKDIYEHVDLLAVRRGEKVTVEVPLTLIGEVARGGLINQELTSISVEAEATHLPSEVQVQISGLELGTVLAAGSLTLPEGSTLAGDPEQTVLVVTEAPSAAQMDAAGGEAAPVVEEADESAA